MNKQYWDNFISGVIAYVYGIRENLDDKPPAYQEGFVFAVWRDKNKK